MKKIMIIQSRYVCAYSEETLPVSEIAIELNDWKGFELWYQKRAWSDLHIWDTCDITSDEGRWFTGILDISKRWHLNVSSVLGGRPAAVALFMRSKYDLNIPDICFSASFALRLLNFTCLFELSNDANLVQKMSNSDFHNLNFCCCNEIL